MSMQHLSPSVRTTGKGLPTWVVISLLVMIVASMALSTVQLSAPTSPSSPTASISASAPAPNGPAPSSPPTAAKTAPAVSQILNPSPGGPTTSAASTSSSGRGVFLTNQQLQNPSPGNQTCSNIYLYYSGICVNNTNSPVMVHTSTGYFVTAYTAMTNQSGCASVRPFTTSEIGISIAKGQPSNWSTPTYLVDSTCSNSTHANNYPSAWSPTMVALPNGTLALAYIEYNWSIGNYSVPGCYDVFPEMYSLQCLTFDRLVFTESYNNGVNWTTPQIINQSASNLGRNYSGMQDPQAPNLAVFGNSLYLAWENLTQPSYYSISAELHMVVSTNGGRSWGSMINLPVQAGSYFGTRTWGATAANMLVSPSGELFLAYVTNYSYRTNYCQGSNCGGAFTVTVMLARSTNNGSSFNYSKIQVVPAGNSVGYWYPLVMTAPRLAYSTSNNELYTVYSGGLMGTHCYYYSSPPYCYSDATPNSLWIDSSTNNGSSWGTARLVYPSVSGSDFGAESGIYNPSIAVSPNGEVYVQASYQNYTQCFTLFGYSGYCGETVQLFSYSTDNATSFTGPYDVSPDFARLSGDSWDGFQSSMVMVNSTPILAWSQVSCPVWNLTGGCFYPYNYGNTHIEISQLFNGVGSTLHFQEFKLPSTLNWSVNVLGNERRGAAGVSLVITGVPANYSYPYTTPWVNKTYGTAYVPTGYPSSPVTVNSSLQNVTVDFNESFLVTISTVPPPPTFSNGFACGPYTYNAYCANQAVTPNPGSSWYPANSTLAYSITPLSTSMTYCFMCYNLSFQSWTGTGNGSFTTTTPNGTTTVHGPINESANFQLLNICDYGVCTALNYTYNFTETGLPNGTLWGLTINGTASFSNLTYLDYNGSAGPVNFTAWSVYYNQTEAYVPSSSASSPLSALTGSFVIIHYRLEPIAGTTVNVTYMERGLPSGTRWAIGFGTGPLSVGLLSGGSTQFSMLTGSYTLNASTVYTQTGVAYYPSSIAVVSLETGNIFGNYTVGSVPGSVQISVGTVVVVVYSPEYQLSATAGIGGSVTPSLLWVHPGATVNLTATPMAGYTFVHWSGTGAGSVSSDNLTIPVTVRGVISEVASFRLIVTEFTVTVRGVGLPSGTPLTVRLGSLAYTGLSPLTIGNLTNGTYSLAIPTIYGSTAGTRYVESSISTGFVMTPSGLQINADGNISVTYVTQYLLQIGSATNGSSQPLAGNYWNDSGTVINLTAMPSPGFFAVSWNGTYNSTGALLTVHLGEPIYEVPTFAVYVPPAPATYTLTVSATGLPAGVAWGVLVGTQGYSTSSVPLTFSGLNGSYVLTVPVVSGGAGVRYIPASSTPSSVTVSSNTSVTINFVTQYLVTIQTSAGGNVSLGTQWVTAGTTLNLTAVAQSGYRFTNWTGTGAGNYTGTRATINITVSGPITELAGFMPNTKASSSNSGLTGATTAAISFGLLAVLLVIGLVVAFVIRRSQGSKRTGGSKPPAATTPRSSGGSTVGSASKGQTAPASEPMTIYQGPGSKK